MKNAPLLLLFLFFASQNLFAQEVYTEFTNPSFEDLPRPQMVPYGWGTCGFKGETPPDIHPGPNGGFFKVNQKAHEGKTYLGMVARENDTWEAITQKLNKPLEANQCYSFNLFMCMSLTYESPVKGKPHDEKVHFNQPLLIRVWGGNKFCEQKELLGVSKLVDHILWENYEFTFSPKSEITHLILEAYFDTPFETPNGNILLDNLSPIYVLDCNDLDSSTLRPKTILSPDEYLKKVVNHYGKDILFKRKNQLTPQAKYALKEIQKAASLTENSKVIFCIHGKKTEKVAARMEILESFLKEIGFDEKTFSVIAHDSNHKHRNWNVINKNILIDLQKTNN